MNEIEDFEDEDQQEVEAEDEEEAELEIEQELDDGYNELREDLLKHIPGFNVSMCFIVIFGQSLTILQTWRREMTQKLFA